MENVAEERVTISGSPRSGDQAKRENTGDMCSLTASCSSPPRFSLALLIPARLCLRQRLWRVGDLFPLLRIMPVDDRRSLLVAQVTQETKGTVHFCLIKSD